MTLCKRPHRLEAYATMLLGLADPDRASFKTLGGRAKLRLSRGRRAKPRLGRSLALPGASLTNLSRFASDAGYLHKLAAIGPKIIMAFSSRFSR
jgi:hypothetical protein